MYLTAVHDNLLTFFPTPQDFFGSATNTSLAQIEGRIQFRMATVAETGVSNKIQNELPPIRFMSQVGPPGRSPLSTLWYLGLTALPPNATGPSTTQWSPDWGKKPGAARSKLDNARIPLSRLIVNFAYD